MGAATVEQSLAGLLIKACCGVCNKPCQKWENVDSVSNGNLNLCI